MTQRRDRHGVLYINPSPAAVALHLLFPSTATVSSVRLWLCYSLCTSSHYPPPAASPEAGFLVNARPMACGPPTTYVFHPPSHR